MLEFYSTNKWYVDGNLPNYAEIVQALAGQFPHLRLAIGPTTLNVGYKGADKPAIENVVQSMGGLKAPGAGLKAPSTNLKEPAGNSRGPDTPTNIEPGTMVLVTMPAIGEIVARFVRMHGAYAVVDLDGIEDVVEFSTLAPLPPMDTKTEPPPPPAEPSVPSVEAKAPSVPPPPPVEVKAPPLEEAKAPNESPSVEANAPSAEEK